MAEAVTQLDPVIANLPGDEADAAKLRVVLWPDPILRRPCKAVTSFDAEAKRRLRITADQMLAMMAEEEGVGLAGPQVGLDVRLFVMDAREGDGPQAYVNPVLSDPDGEEEGEEGCLSLPEIRTPVLRSRRLRLTAKTPEGDDVDVTADGFVARVWQHEIDHLNGVLILDKMPPSVKMAVKKDLKLLETRYAKRKK